MSQLFEQTNALDFRFLFSRQPAWIFHLANARVK